MVAHKKTGTFLKTLILHLDHAEQVRAEQVRAEQVRADHRLLCDHLSKAEHEKKSICRAVFLAMLLLMFSAAGLGYCAILMPEVFHSPGNLLIRSLAVLGLGSLISQAIFLGYLVWHHAVAARLHEEGRRVVLALALARLQAPAIASLTAQVQMQPPNPFSKSSTEQTEESGMDGYL